MEDLNKNLNLTRSVNMKDNDASLINSNLGTDLKYNILKPQGISGLNRLANFVYDDFLINLRGREGAKVYKEMSMNDPTIGAFIYAITCLIRNVPWRIEAAGNSDADKIAAEFVQSCLDDMNTSFDETVSDILSFIIHGWSVMEINYKIRKGPNVRNPYKRSKYNDFRIGWEDWSIRNQETMWCWEFDSENHVLTMVQLAPPDFKTRRIPIEKCMLFRTKSNKNNPEGLSLLRNAYRPWYFKKNIEEIEAIGAEKDLTGIPVLKLPAELLRQAAINSEEADVIEAKNIVNEYKKIITGLRRNSEAGVIIPSSYNENGQPDYELSLLNNGTTRKQFDTDQIIKRYDNEIAKTVLAEWLQLGTNTQGSYALSNDKTSMFKSTLNTVLKIIENEINRKAIPDLIRLNQFEGLTDYPKIKHGKIDEFGLNEIANFICQLTNNDVIDFKNDTNLEDFLREKANLPVRPNYENTPDMELDNGNKELL